MDSQKRTGHSGIAPHGFSQLEAGDDLDVYLEADGVSDGQRRRLLVFKDVEPGVCARVESLCEEAALEVTDVAVLVVAPQANEAFFDREEERVQVIMGHRDEVYGFLAKKLPPASDAPYDPYEDLLEPAPMRCVRVLILDDESLTVMSYGAFVTVSYDPANVAQA